MSGQNPAEVTFTLMEGFPIGGPSCNVISTVLSHQFREHQLAQTRDVQRYCGPKQRSGPKYIKVNIPHA